MQSEQRLQPILKGWYRTICTFDVEIKNVMKEKYSHMCPCTIMRGLHSNINVFVKFVHGGPLYDIGSCFH